jgi:hypothetical protein
MKMIWKKITVGRLAALLLVSPRARSEDDGDDGRSASIFSGAGTGRRGKGKSSDEDEAGSMIDDLQDFQRKSGFF